MECIKCQSPIPSERLEALPDTQFCVNCSEEKPKIGFTDWDKKTPELLIVETEDFNRLEKLEKYGGRLGRLK